MYKVVFEAESVESLWAIVSVELQLLSVAYFITKIMEKYEIRIGGISTVYLLNYKEQT